MFCVAFSLFSTGCTGLDAFGVARKNEVRHHPGHRPTLEGVRMVQFVQGDLEEERKPAARMQVLEDVSPRAEVGGGDGVPVDRQGVGGSEKHWIAVSRMASWAALHELHVRDTESEKHPCMVGEMRRLRRRSSTVQLGNDLGATATSIEKVSWWKSP